MTFSHKNWISIVLIFLMSACATKTTQFHSQVQVSITDQDRIRFSGKGAGAGAMMAASMGPMGVAIGVAIDEGIAKDIQDAFIASCGNFQRIVEDVTRRKLNDHCVEATATTPLCQSGQVLNVTVYHYGFISASGDDDPVQPELELGFWVNGSGEERMTLVSGEQLKQPLELVKRDGKATARVLEKAYASVFDQFVLRIQ